MRRINNRAGDMQNLMNVTLMMVILAFFIVLNAISVPSDSKKKEALGSLTGSLGILEGGLSPGRPTGKKHSLIPGPLLSKQVSAAQLIGKFEQYMIEKKNADKVTEMLSRGGLELSIQSSLLFSPGSATFTSSGEEIVDQLTKLLTQIEGNLVIEGHTSSNKIISARYRTPQDLSTAQAGAVIRSMEKRGLTRKGDISIAGYGSSRPLVPNDSRQNRDKNDRIRISYRFAL